MLNNEQLEVVNHIYGPAAVLSGAGSGKTTTLINRIEHLVTITDPNKIVMLTFTNAAADEMKRRASRVNEACKDIIAFTYHKYCSIMLRQYGKIIGIYPGFEILTPNKYETFIEYVKSSNEYYESLKDFPSASKLAHIFSVITNTDATISKLIYNTKYESYAQEIQNLYNDVKQAGLEQQKFCFDDILVYMNDLLNNDDICEKIALSFDYLMVDEFQDTNDLQLRLLLKLSKYNSNIVVVGDVSQSIYKFRGAKVQNIRKFIDSFSDCKQFKLTTNYRSTQEIIDAANSIMNHNVKSWEYVNMVSNDKHGDIPSIVYHRNEYNQADWIVSKINSLVDLGYDLSQIAIIERKSISSFRLENELIKAGIPFIKRGGRKFMDYKVIDEIISFLSVIINPKDKFSWFNIFRLLPGIGGKTSTTITDHCLDKNFPDQYKKRKFYPDLIDLMTNIDTYKTNKDNISELISNISEYYFELRTAKAEKAKSSSTRDDALTAISKDKEIVNIFKDMSIRYDTLKEFLEDIALDSLKQSNSDDQLIITTIHSAKGLEWPVTILIDSIEDEKTYVDEEEELRCFYVALTRAEDELVLSIPSSSIKNGLMVFNTPTHFLRDSTKYFKDSRNTI